MKILIDKNLTPLTYKSLYGEVNNFYILSDAVLKINIKIYNEQHYKSFSFYMYPEVLQLWNMDKKYKAFDILCQELIDNGISDNIINIWKKEIGY